jgi:hypothetical protein
MRFAIYKISLSLDLHSESPMRMRKPMKLRLRAPASTRRAPLRIGVRSSLMARVVIDPATLLLLNQFVIHSGSLSRVDLECSPNKQTRF